MQAIKLADTQVGRNGLISDTVEFVREINVRSHYLQEGEWGIDAG